MTRIHKNTFVPYSAEEMYALVNDIRAYPQFLPWCKGAEVVNETATRLQATVALEAGRVKQSFSTQNSMQPGRSIEMQLLEGPFRFMTGRWQFEPQADHRCMIDLNIEFEFKNKLLKLALSGTFNKVMDSMVEAFTRRAEQIYGKR